jgi:hypothetical protein
MPSVEQDHGQKSARRLHKTGSCRGGNHVTDGTDRRESGAWIGQHPDENTERVREQLDEGAERVAITNNESGASPDDESWPQGHRTGDAAGDDDVRRAGENG